MAVEQLANEAVSTLLNTITNVATTLDVVSAAAFPSVPQFRIRIGTELLLVTGVSGVTFTVTRGTEGTTAVSHLGAAPVTHVLTTAGLSTAITDRVAAGRPQIEIPLVSSATSTSNSVFTRAGGRPVDLTPHPAMLGALTRTLTFRADIETSIGSATANVRLQNMTDNETVTGTALSTTNLASTEVSATLTVGVASGNFKTGVLYAVQISLSGGGGSDSATITNARLEVTYA